MADLAAAALDASLAIARATTRFPADEVAGTRLAIIGMGKAGARELNYVSDVDVIFVAGGAGIPDERAVEIATRLAMDTMRGIQELALEPPLWEVDANLRPEGKDGALVRTLDSHRAYYERWAKNWEFQALLKARPLAGDRRAWATRFVEMVAPRVWGSASHEGFVESVQRMRERVTENIPAAEVDVQLKLGPGGLRDVEFTIQLLQLVHGQADPGVRQPATLDALDALARGGYIGREEAAEFARDYRFLRLLEHRLQLSRLRRTHLMPRDENALRVLARATGLHSTAAALIEDWRRTQHAVRSLHERLFYRPLLSAVAALPDGGISLTSEQAEARLAAIGFARSARRLAPHRRADRGSVAAGDDPAHAAAGHAAVVRGGRGSRLRPARVPAPVRRPGRGVLVPADAARLIRRRPPPDLACCPHRGSSASSSSGSPRRRPGWRTTPSCGRVAELLARRPPRRSRGMPATRMPLPPPCAPRGVARCCGWPLGDPRDDHRSTSSGAPSAT